MAYRVEILEETRQDLRDYFSASEARRITRKIHNIAATAPDSFALLTRLKGTEADLARIGADSAYEVTIGSGYRAAIVVFDQRQLIVWYMAATHDSANRMFLSTLARLEEPEPPSLPNS